ncbi:hypothetical protein BDQ12DRAFT_645556 [Crucibulum laeve]|uniref:Uncharacterized protein n=1 Tax=Crucibulum laeve TaxID=68775 RepID=A0A5C3MBR6_9AGAR|nr:hypothetical protein BDQ12DRAFT_645556 [Crucibulum laeve]
MAHSLVGTVSRRAAATPGSPESHSSGFEQSFDNAYSNSEHTVDPRQNHYQPPRHSSPGNKSSSKIDSHSSRNPSSRSSAADYLRHRNHYAGAEPGVNPRRGSSIAEYSHFKQECVIEVVDYDSDDALFRRMGNEEFVRLMKEPEGKSDAHLKGQKGREMVISKEDGDDGVQTKGPEEELEELDDDEDWPPRAVRWINIGGIDWNVISFLALRYNLHSLALEDVLHEQGHNHSKADYYPEHLFLRVLSHALVHEAVANKEHKGDPHKFTPMQPNSIPGSGGGGFGGELEREPTNEFPGSGRMGAGLSAGLGMEWLPSKGSRNGKGNGNGNENGNGDVERGEAGAGSREDQGTSVSSMTPMIKKPGPNAYGTVDGNASHGMSGWRKVRMMPGIRAAAARRQILKIQALTKGDRVNIKHEPIFIFLLRDGTVISIHPTASLQYTDVIAERLHHHDSVLRTSEDASLLVESLLDLIVDRILEVMDEYQLRIHRLEHDILMSPGMDTVRSLHILSGDLIMHKRTLDPIKTMIYGLRRYDLDRCMALADHMDRECLSSTESSSSSSSSSEDSSESDSEYEKPPLDKGLKGQKTKKTKTKTKKVSSKEKNTEKKAKGGKEKPKTRRQIRRQRARERRRKEREQEERRWRKQRQANKRSGKVEGFFSYKAKVYLADVYDHMDFALTSLDMFAGITENLINYAFNTASYDMNKVMKRLTLVTIIFLPLTLLTGYFGMNFTPMWSVDQNSDLLFWKIAIPVMAVLIPLFMYDDIRKAVRHLKQRMATREAVKAFAEKRR